MMIRLKTIVREKHSDTENKISHNIFELFYFLISIFAYLNALWGFGVLDIAEVLCSMVALVGALDHS